jgi:hypothetical protein
MAKQKALPKKPRHFIVWGTAVFIGVVVLSYLFLGSRAPEADANVAHLYASSCLGGWSNPDRAIGEPDVTSVGDRYSDSNSAVYNDNQASLYCGGYTGSIPPDTKHTDVVLRFSWTQNVTEAPLSYPTLPTTKETESLSTTTEEISSSTSEVMDNQEISQEEEMGTPSNENSSEEINPPVEATLPEETPEVSVPPEAESVPEENSAEPISLFKIFNVAYAEEVPVEADSLEAQFRVEFTLDGATWNILGYVSDVSNDVKLTFPKEAFLSMEDISRVQIGLVPLLQIDGAPEPVYLDAMWLEVEYAPVVQTALHDTIEHNPKTYSFSELSFDSAYSASTSSSTTASSTATSPHITPQSVVRIHGIDKRFVLVHTMMHDEEYRLWLFDLLAQEATVLADNVLTIGAHKGGVKERMIFWYNANKDKVYVYDLRTAGTYHELLVVQNLPENSEVIEYGFPFTTWKLIDGPEEFYFRSDETGEVFSDGIAEGVAQFVLTFELYTVWSREELEALSLTGL